jgi:Mn2+/Fe2+ NRAMP family transporter
MLSTPAAAVPPGTESFARLGSGLITGAADDDPSAVGTRASAGAKFGPAFLWMAPLPFPMMFAVVFAKLGQVTGRGLFGVMEEHHPRCLLHFALTWVLGLPAGIVDAESVRGGYTW